MSRQTIRNQQDGHKQKLHVATAPVSEKKQFDYWRRARQCAKVFWSARRKGRYLVYCSLSKPATARKDEVVILERNKNNRINESCMQRESNKDAHPFLVDKRR